MRLVSRKTLLADMLILLGLVLLGAGVFLWLGLAAALTYAGVALFAIGVVMATVNEVRP